MSEPNYGQPESVLAPSQVKAEGATFARTFFKWSGCIHATMHKDCPSCLMGHAARMEHQLVEKQAEISRAKETLQKACDRDWKDETLEVTAIIASNAIYWRDENVKKLQAEISRLTQERDEADKVQLVFRKLNEKLNVLVRSERSARQELEAANASLREQLQNRGSK
jgi:hypothetical protein